MMTCDKNYKYKKYPFKSIALVLLLKYPPPVHHERGLDRVQP